MAGGGGGGGSGERYPTSGRSVGVGGGADPCDLKIRTVINGPDPVLVSGLKTGDVLQVVLGGPNSRTIQVRLLTTAQVVGSLVGFGDAGRLTTCMSAGHEYGAEVLAISGGKVDVEIYRTATP